MKTIVRKVVACAMMFVGLFAGSAIDSEVSFTCTMLLAGLFFVGVFGGGALYIKGEPISELK